MYDYLLCFFYIAFWTDYRFECEYTTYMYEYIKIYGSKVNIDVIRENLYLVRSENRE